MKYSLQAIVLYLLTETLKKQKNLHNLPKEADVLRSSSLSFGMNIEPPDSVPVSVTLESCLLRGNPLFIGVGKNFSL